jgi:NADPH:quinone reductase-like Zn-dependent oxidoreductase
MARLGSATRSEGRPLTAPKRTLASRARACFYEFTPYKDGLAITGKAPIIRKFPLIPGIDLAGRVTRSEDPRFQRGDRVVLNGYGLGEVHHGGYAELARVKGDWLIRLPENISTAQAMAIGTAGYYRGQGVEHCAHRSRPKGHLALEQAHSRGKPPRR